MVDHDRPSAGGGRDLKRQCRGLGMAGKTFIFRNIHNAPFFSPVSSLPPPSGKLWIPESLIHHSLCLQTNRPFPSCFEPHHESEASCIVFTIKN